MARVFVGVGSNVEPERNVPTALAAVVERFGKTQASPAYRSRPVGFDGEDFINLVIAFDSELSPASLVDTLHAIEADCGRERGAKRFAPRIIDLDLLLVDDVVTRSGGRPTLPREEIMHYAFVLRPLSELAPDRHHPVEGVSFRELWVRHRGRMDGDDLRAIALSWPDGIRPVA